MKVSILFLDILYSLNCFCIQTLWKTSIYFQKKITKYLDKDLFVYRKGSIQEQVCSFAAKWKNDKNRLKMEKSCQNKGS